MSKGARSAPSAADVLQLPLTWSGVLGELYSGAVETRMANDYEELLDWFEDDDALPRTVREANFHPERFNTLRSRLSAAYKGINVLVLRTGIGKLRFRSWMPRRLPSTSTTSSPGTGVKSRASGRIGTTAS